MRERSHSFAPASHGRPAAAQIGMTLLESCAALALSSLAALALLGGLRPLSCAFRVEAARATLVDALLEARRSAYEGEVGAAVGVQRGDSGVTLLPAGARRSLPDGVALSSVPADEDVQFRATGLAENATVAVACGASEASVVVNQRGVIR